MMLVRIWFLLILLLILRVGLYYGRVPKIENGQTVTIEGEIDSQPDIVGSSQTFKVAGYQITTPLTPEWHFGDKVRITGQITCFENFRCLRGRFKRPAVELLKQKDPWNILMIGQKIRNYFQEVYFSSLPRSQANLLSGIVLGSLGLDRQLKNDLIRVGLTHIVAASGMNITLWVGFVLGVFTYFHWSKRWLLFSGLVSVWLYASVTGFEPAILRASLMASLVLAGQLVGRKSGSWGGLLASGYFLLWVDPSLAINFGFLLSFTSMMGQISFSTLEFKVPIWARFFKDMLGQNLAAIVFTFPIVMAGFSKFSLISMGSNLLVTWTVEPLMMLGGFAEIIGIWLPSLAKIIFIPAEILLSYFLWVVKLLSRDEFLLIVKDFNLFLVIGYYLILWQTISFLKHRNMSKSIRP